MLPPEEVKYKMPGGRVTSFIDRSMKEAQIKQYPNGYYYGEIPSCQGVWATGDTIAECISTLQEVLEDWILFKLHDNDMDFPVYDDINLNAEWKEDVSWAEPK
jgi:predicted RNase H-like HicB family nuclease